MKNLSISKSSYIFRFCLPLAIWLILIPSFASMKYGKILLPKPLIEEEANTNTRDEADQMPTISYVKDGVDINTQNNQGETALHWAVKNKRMTMTKQLVEKGANVNVKDKDGQTPLHIVAAFGEKDFVELLMKHGGDPTIKNVNGWSPVDFAFYGEHINIAFLLLENHPPYPVNPDDYDLFTKLANAMKYEKIHLIKPLIEEGANINTRDEVGRMPIISAVRNKDINLINFLIRRGADLNVKTLALGEPLLHLAIYNESAKIVKILLEAGVDPSAKNDAGLTPLDAASKPRQPSIVNMITARFTSKAEKEKKISKDKNKREIERKNAKRDISKKAEKKNRSKKGMSRRRKKDKKSCLNYFK